MAKRRLERLLTKEELPNPADYPHYFFVGTTDFEEFRRGPLFREMPTMFTNSGQVYVYETWKWPKDSDLLQVKAAADRILKESGLRGTGYEIIKNVLILSIDLARITDKEFKTLMEIAKEDQDNR